MAITFTRAHWTNHARERLKEMKLSEDEIFTVLNDPETTYEQQDRANNQRVYQRGDLSVVTGKGRIPIIITILWRRTEAWTREEFAQHRLTKNREQDGQTS